ncbi:MAG: hypothetical protein V3T20_00580, partial [Gemmatimonadota bacterium]
MAKRLSSLRAIAFCASVLMSTPALAQEAAEMDEAARQAALAKKSQKPVAHMSSVPCEVWYNDGENG